ncbi:MAG TPA: hypothetical protein PLK94_00665 [Alphaproteobacteria bacterium]|nr:hypothetical protein [Alphaproteobacteria bacterium]HOO49777.1 hypothetical protein [Alphaproteobacteria bacterium]
MALELYRNFVEASCLHGYDRAGVIVVQGREEEFLAQFPDAEIERNGRSALSVQMIEAAIKEIQDREDAGLHGIEDTADLIQLNRARLCIEETLSQVFNSESPFSDATKQFLQERDGSQIIGFNYDWEDRGVQAFDTIFFDRIRRQAPTANSDGISLKFFIRKGVKFKEVYIENDEDTITKLIAQISETQASGVAQKTANEIQYQRTIRAANCL